MSFALLRRQQARIQEVAQSGTYDSVLQAVENAAAARAFTDEGANLSRGAKNKQRMWSAAGAGTKDGNQENGDEESSTRTTKRLKTAEDEMLMQHHGTISMNESVARKVANARMNGDSRKNIQDNQRRFLHNRMKPHQLKHVVAAQEQAKYLMRRKNESGDPLALKSKKTMKKNGNSQQKKQQQQKKKGKSSL